MSLCPFSVHRLLPETDGDGKGDQPRIEPRVAILHSAAGRGSLYGWFLNSSSLESHFWVSDEGVIEQYGDTSLRADANRKANAFAVSIETESSREATERWTPAQAAAIVRLLDWLCTVHPAITRQQCPAWDGSGIGWHVQFGSPGPWTPVAKSCPGPARIEQARNEIIPAVCAGTPTPEPKGWLMALTDDQQDDLYQKVKDIHGALSKGGEVRDAVVSTKRHAVDGVPAKPGTPKDKLTWPQRVTAALARLEAKG